MHFWEIIILSFNLRKNAIDYFVFLRFLQILFINYLWKMHGYPLFSFWISITHVKIYISCIIINQGKNTFELVGTLLQTILYLKHIFSHSISVPFPSCLTLLWIISAYKENQKCHTEMVGTTNTNFNSNSLLLRTETVVKMFYKHGLPKQNPNAHWY